MRARLLDWLACPLCGSGLAFTPSCAQQGGADVETGALACASCAREFPIVDSIPRLVPGALDSGNAKTRESFSWEWLRYPGSLPEDKPIFLSETQLPESYWRGRLILDGGCGMGRYTRVALALGAEVVALDLSESLVRLLDRARVDPKLHLVQGDLLKPPLREDSFDAAYSIGVIHHTPSAPKAHASLSKLVKKGGHLSVWVYGSPGSYASFSTNPLRSGRSWLKSVLPLVWAVVWLRMLLSDGLRLLTTRLPVPALYALCYPLTWLGAVPLLKYLTFSVHPDFQVRLIENFDWLAPPYQSKHTKEEVRAWFERADLEIVSQLPHGVVPKVGFLGRKL